MKDFFKIFNLVKTTNFIKIINFLKILFDQFKDFTVILLIICAVGNALTAYITSRGSCTDCLIIISILIINALFGAWQEYRAFRILGAAAEDKPTPLQRRLSRIGRIICLMCIIICIFIFITGIFLGEGCADMLIASVSLAVAAVPEGLPIMVTIMLSGGICRLRETGVTVRKLSAAEGLGLIKVLFLRLDRLYGDEKRLFRSAGIALIDIDRADIFYRMKKKGLLTGVIGEEEAHITLMKEADMPCTFSDCKALYKYAHIIFENTEGAAESIRAGRGIYESLRTGLNYILSCNIGEILTVAAGLLLKFPLTLLGVQLLLINLITDALPAIAIATEPYRTAMGPQPPKENIFTKGFSVMLLAEGGVIAFVSIVAFGFGNALFGVDTGRSMAFCVLCLSQLFHSFNHRGKRLFKNKLLCLSFVVGLALTLGAVTIYAPTLKLAPLSPVLIFDSFLLGIVPFMLFEYIPDRGSI